MQKIMFNNTYGLNDGVLEGWKTMTRRIINEDVDSFYEFGIDKNGKIYGTFYDSDGRQKDIYPRFQVGDEVAVAQCYKDLCYSPSAQEMIETEIGKCAEDSPGWNNKMFVKGELMPERIIITNIKAERLQDISDEDCLREGIIRDDKNGKHIGYPFSVPFVYTFRGVKNHWSSPKEAFATLIDNVGKRGTWRSNPYVYVYEFKLKKLEV